MSELSEKVKEKLTEAIGIWADEVLPGRPSILAFAAYTTVERALREQQEYIESNFPLQEAEHGDYQK